MEIILENAGKKFNTEWILRQVNLHLTAGNGYAFTGANGSGKSTLIRLLTGQLPVTEGNIKHRYLGKEIHVDDWYRLIIMAAPYLELVEEFSLQEFVKFHQSFKKFKNQLTVKQFLDFSELSHAQNKLIRHFSSGMKQRLRLALAFQTDVPVVLLDEPTSNLDSKGIDWYQQNVSLLLNQGQLLVIGSNQPAEYALCQYQVRMSDYKR
ncbi:MAG: ATP-binding cassette domain-containing protein [Spirosomataceae bacterium]